MNDFKPNYDVRDEVLADLMQENKKLKAEVVGQPIMIKHLRDALMNIHNDCSGSYVKVVNIAIKSIDDGERLPHASPITVSKLLAQHDSDIIYEEIKFFRAIAEDSKPLMYEILTDVVIENLQQHADKLRKGEV